jgi:hypothetical protein
VGSSSSAISAAHLRSRRWRQWSSSVHGRPALRAIKSDEAWSYGIIVTWESILLTLRWWRLAVATFLLWAWAMITIGDAGQRPRRFLNRSTLSNAYPDEPSPRNVGCHAPSPFLQDQVDHAKPRSKREVTPEVSSGWMCHVRSLPDRWCGRVDTHRVLIRGVHKYLQISNDCNDPMTLRWHATLGERGHYRYCNYHL